MYSFNQSYYRTKDEYYKNQLMRLIEVDSRSYLITFRDNQLSSEYVNIVIRSSLYTYFEFPSISSEELAKIKYIEFD